MGRSSTTKRATGLTGKNEHNPKHENGLVGPAKKVVRQRSNGHLNGSAKSQATTTTPPLPSTPPSANGQANSTSEIIIDCKMPSQLLRRTSLAAASESESSEPYNNMLNGHSAQTAQESHRQINVNATKNPAVHRDAGPLGLILTVLRACPLYDTIAILIVLLQIPPTFLTIVHLLFASLTFVPPSTSAGTGFSVTDIFEGTLVTPSVAVMIIIDCFALLVFVLLWKPLQDVAFDLAQTVIALTLGGGTSGKDSGFNNVLVSFGVIGLSQLARNGGAKHTALRGLFGSSGIDSDDPLDASLPPYRKGTYSWVRNIFAVHILSQGIIRYVRDWYVRRERRDSLLSGAADPEAAKASVPHIEHPTNDSSNANSSVDLDILGTLPINNDKSTNTKKKRRANAQVRSRQPLWAALASTKIVMAKEYESSRSATESAGANATDINNLGNAPFTSEADRIWVTYVGFDEVCFNTSFFLSHSFIDRPAAEDDGAITPGIDKSKPFYIRVNRTIWQPTRINPIEDSTANCTEVRWSGDIYGLAPMSSYDCEFISTFDDSLIFSTSVRTMQPPTTDTSAASALAPNTQRSVRPDSPTTTLKNSIATSQVKLDEERTRQKRERKEQKAKVNSTRREIEKLTSSISSSGGNDDRLRQKVQQSNLHAKQADEAVLTIDEELEDLENRPQDNTDEWKIAQQALKSQKDDHRRSRDAFVEAKRKADGDIQSLTTDLASVQQKKERMHNRISKLQGEYERITDANRRGIGEAQRKRFERDTKEAERAAAEMMYLEKLDRLTANINEYQQAHSAVWASIHAVHQAEFIASQAHAPPAQLQPSPTTAIHPYDMKDNVHPSYQWNTNNHFSHHSAMQQQNYTARGRSSSMHSNVSGFTQSSLDEPPLPHDARGIIERERQKSDGSSSGSGSGSGSICDPKSPVIGIASTTGGYKKLGFAEEGKTCGDRE